MQLDSSKSPLVENKELNIRFNTNFNFSFAMYHPEHKIVVLFVDGWSGELSFVGKIFSISGKEIHTIPFPPDGVGFRQNSFGGAHVSDSDIRIIFHQQNERDYWGEYSIKEKKYVRYHEAR